MYTSPITDRIKRQRVHDQEANHHTTLDDSGEIEARDYDFDAPTPRSDSNRLSLLSSTTKKNINRVDVDFVKLKSEVSRLNHKLAVMTVELESQRAKHKTATDALEARIGELVRERRLLLESETDLRAKLCKNDHGDDDERTSMKESKLARALEAKNEECFKLEERLAELVGRIKQLEQLECKSGTPLHYSPQVVIASDTESQTTESASSWREQLAFLQEQLEKMSKENKSKELQETALRLLTLTSENARLKADNEFLKRINQNRLMMEEKMHTFDRRMAEFEELKAKHADLQARLDKREESLVDESQIKEYQSKIVEQSGQLEDCQATISRLKSTCEMTKNQISSLRSELLTANDKIDGLQEQLLMSQKERQVLQTECDNLRAQINH